MFDREEMLKVVGESHSVLEQDEDGFAFGAADRSFHVHFVGKGLALLYAEVQELEDATDDRQFEELARKILSANARLLESGPFSFAVNPTREFVHIQWLFDPAKGGEDAFRAWLPQFVAGVDQWE